MLHFYSQMETHFNSKLQKNPINYYIRLVAYCLQINTDLRFLLQYNFISNMSHREVINADAFGFPVIFYSACGIFNRQSRYSPHYAPLSFAFHYNIHKIVDL